MKKMLFNTIQQNEGGEEVADYKKLYFQLFSRLAKITEQLIQIQQDMEWEYINSKEFKIYKLDLLKQQKEKAEAMNQENKKK